MGIINKKRQLSESLNKDCKFGNEVRFLFVGRLVPEKNILFLCQAFDQLIERNIISASLTIIGDGILYNRLKQYNFKKVNIVGYINNDDISKYYNNNDIFVLPSISEPWGLVV